MKAIHESAFLLYRQPIIMPARPVARTKELRCSLTTTSPAVKATSADDIDEEAMMMVSLSNLYVYLQHIVGFRSSFVLEWKRAFCQTNGAFKII